MTPSGVSSMACLARLCEVPLILTTCRNLRRWPILSTSPMTMIPSAIASSTPKDDQWAFSVADVISEIKWLCNLALLVSFLK